MATLSLPTNTPTPDGAIIGCTTDDTTGTAYAMARDDRQWYFEVSANPLVTQAMIDADKAAIIAQDITASELVWAGNDVDLTSVALTVTGLDENAGPFYVGWVRPESAAGPRTTVTTDFYVGTAPYTFTRTGAYSDQMAPDSNGLVIVRGENLSAHPYADFDGSTYTNTSGISQGVLMEGARTNIGVWISYFEGWRWSIAGTCTKTAGQTAPDGSSTAALIEGVSTANDKLTYSPGVLGANDADIANSICIKRVTTTGTMRFYNSYSGALGDWSIDFSQLSDDWEKLHPLHPAVSVTNTWKATATGQSGLAFGPATTQPSSFYLWCPQLEEAGFASSTVINVDATANTRPATELSVTMTNLGLPTTSVNNVAGQITVRPQFNPTESRGAATAIMQMYGDADNHIALLWAADTDVISLVKTVGGTVVGTATYANGDIGYSAGDELVIAWTATPSGMTLQVTGFAEKTDTNTADLSTAVGTVYVARSGAGQHAFQSTATITVEA